ncbi:MAG: hypothetical protein IKU10_03805, partial [Clostridia bacterium]|nr:hypothetical protein [Clostridia bacterium]
MKNVKRYLALLLALVTLLSVAGSAVLAVESSEGTADPSTTTPTDVAALLEEEAPVKVEKFSKYKYSEYMDDHAQTPYATGNFTVDANTYLPESVNVKNDTQYEAKDAEAFKSLNGKAGASILTQEDSTVVWNINVPADGLYAINVLYYTVTGKNSDIERSLFIDGEQPFTEAGALIFPRTWMDDPEDFKKDEKTKEFVLDDAGNKVFKTDVHNNQIRPGSLEVNGWYDINCRDASGNYGEHLYFYLTAGSHKLTMTSQREPMVINRLTFFAPAKLPTYADLKADYAAKGYKNGTDASVEEDSVSIKVQAERPSEKSSTTLYAEYDRTNPAMEPYSYDTIALNEIDGGKFTTPYQWLSWEMDVKEAGLYRIVTRFQQSAKDGTFCTRILYINGKVPCEEAKHVRFEYDSSWQVKALSTPEGEEMLFYFDEGINTITLQVSLGEFGDILDRVDTAVYELNECYRDILMITGSAPDAYRDYGFDDLIPDTLKMMEKNSAEIKQIVTDIETLVGDTGSFTSSFKTLVQDIDTMTENPRVIAKRLQNFKSNLGTISTWLLTATSQPVSLDWVMLTPAEEKLPKAGKGFFAGVKHQFMMFIASFYMDYDDVGRLPEGENVGEKEEIKVWVTTSLDQSQILRSLIDNNQADLPCKVNLQLVSAATVLPSIAAGTGPDIVLGVGASDPINYAIRGAVLDMSQFDTYEEVLKRFNKNAIIPYQYEKNGVKRTYGLPETFTFPM